jgi:hypothetical protein
MNQKNKEDLKEEEEGLIKDNVFMMEKGKL